LRARIGKRAAKAVHLPALLLGLTVGMPAGTHINNTQYPLPNYVTPVGITNGPDGALWFTEYEGNSIGRITTSGAITTFPIPTEDSGPAGITTGPDGDLWFTEFNADQIGRISTSGVVTEYAVPTANSAPDGIAAGPDGALWFTELNGGKIGRITTDGLIAEYPPLP